MRKLLLTLIAVLSVVMINAQQLSVTGTVVSDSDGLPIPGVSVAVKGTTTGTITDIDGKFEMSAAEGATLVFSFIGMETQELVAAANMNVVMVDELAALSEVVVVGYGVQKKSVVTAAIAKVSSDDLANTKPLRMDNALKGLAAGVNVTSASGQPGEGAKVRIRGTGTFNNSNPLYIVDGMPIDGGLDFVNPNDIESIEVLKDAASGAIYGARAANGVILVTTKKGKVGKPTLNYNVSYGWASAEKHREVTNATEYAILQNERNLNNGVAPEYADPYNLIDSNGNPIVGDGTDWQELVFNDNAPTMNHDVSFSGATDRDNYYFSIGYYSQDGIVGGNYGQSNYDRLTIRSNFTHTLVDETETRPFLNKLDFGVNMAYMRTHSTAISTNSEFGSILGSALYLSPLVVPVATGEVAEAMKNNYTYTDDNGEIQLYDLPADANGNPYTIAPFVGSYQEISNPLAMLAIDPTKNWSHKFVPNFVVDLQLFEGLRYKFSYGADLSFWGNDGATKSCYYISGNNHKEHTEATAYKSQGCNWQIENLLIYDKEIAGHSFNIVLGQSAMETKGSDLGGSRMNLVNVNKPSINYATGDIVFSTTEDKETGNVIINGATVQHGVWGGPVVQRKTASLFARLNYNYNERYMMTATVRRDGSSRFGENNKYGIFPSFSLGWNVTNESFMENRPVWLNSMKLRGSWGLNGNDNIDDFGYTSLTAMGNNVLFGKNAIKYNGSKAQRLSNPDLKWEESEQTDIAVDLMLFDGAVTATVEWYNKRTNDMLIDMPVPSYTGETPPLGNGGDMENKGWEFELGYKWSVADANFSIKGNAAYVKNTLKDIGNEDGYLDYGGIQGISGGGMRAQNGLPYPFFFGYKTAGVFQNADEVAAYTNAEGGLIMPNAVAGDVRFVDVNGDGKIDPEDRTNIGNGTPEWTFGLAFNADWKGIDFSLNLHGVGEAKVFDATYRNDIFSGNFPKWMLERWTGEGTSNKLPRLGGNTENWQMSDIYIHDGSFLRLKNMQLGYTLPKQITEIAGINRFRVFVAAENLATWTKYHGFDPEISSGAGDSQSLGVDRGVYPQARTFTVGANITF